LLQYVSLIYVYLVAKTISTREMHGSKEAANVSEERGYPMEMESMEWANATPVA